METPEGARTLPHCALHQEHVIACPICRQARANAEPYIARRQAPLPRAFGFKDDITAATFGGARRNAFSLQDEPGEVSFSLLAIRFLLRLVWPFGRIL